MHLEKQPGLKLVMKKSEELSKLQGFYLLKQYHLINSREGNFCSPI